MDESLRQAFFDSSKGKENSKLSHASKFCVCYLSEVEKFWKTRKISKVNIDKRY